MDYGNFYAALLAKRNAGVANQDRKSDSPIRDQKRIDTLPAQSHDLRGILAAIDWENAEWIIKQVNPTLYIVFYGLWPLYQINVSQVNRSPNNPLNIHMPIDDVTQFVGVLSHVDQKVFDLVKNSDTGNPELAAMIQNKDLTGKRNAIMFYHAALLLNCWFPYATKESVNLVDSEQQHDLVLNRLTGKYLAEFGMTGSLNLALSQFADFNSYLIVSNASYHDIIMTQVLDNWAYVFNNMEFIQMIRQDEPAVANVVKLANEIYRFKVPNNDINMLYYNSMGMLTINSLNGMNKYGMRFYAPVIINDEVIPDRMNVEATLDMEFSRRVNRYEKLWPVHQMHNDYHMAWNVNYLHRASQESIEPVFTKMFQDRIRTRYTIDREKQGRGVAVEDKDAKEMLMNDVLRGREIRLEKSDSAILHWNTTGAYADLRKAIWEAKLPVDRMLEKERQMKRVTPGIPLCLLPVMYKFVKEGIQDNWKLGSATIHEGVESIIMYCRGFPLFVLYRMTAIRAGRSGKGEWNLVPQGQDFYELSWYTPPYVPVTVKKAFRSTWLANICLAEPKRKVKEQGVTYATGWLKTYNSLFDLGGALSDTLRLLRLPVMSLITARELMFSDDALQIFGTFWEVPTTRPDTLFFSRIGNTTRAQTAREKGMTDMTAWAMINRDVRYLSGEDEVRIYITSDEEMVLLKALTDPVSKKKRKYYKPKQQNSYQIKLAELPLAWNVTVNPRPINQAVVDEIQQKINAVEKIQKGEVGGAIDNALLAAIEEEFSDEDM